ncbi:hypothetical protein ACFP2T_26415 [Plantactinospora solaniradicis]|uniref:Uncharacterized protein n=1 Tax=Plantactinospora solaniradicis TaxID=1723736 RepID=A0ABW1KFZ9_9ACTN
MTDNLGSLRQAMSDLAEHGGSADMYERSLHKSRQVQRRARVATAATAAVAVFAIGGAVALGTANRPSPPAPGATQTPSPSIAPTPAVPSRTPPSSPHSSTRTSNRPRYPDCPSATTLEKLADLPKDWRFVPSRVKCWKNWATADAEGPTAGDGVYLFQYKAGTGWRYHSQGSGFYCEDLGITSGNPPFCEMN